MLAAVHLLVTVFGHESLLTFTLLQATMMGCFGLATSNFGALAMEHVGKVAGTASSLQGSFATIMGALIGIVAGQAFDGTTIPLYASISLCGIGALAAILITERGRLLHSGHQGSA